jgi:hypothetical protein
VGIGLQGRFNSSKPEPPVWIADAPNAVGHPDEADSEVLK